MEKAFKLPQIKAEDEKVLSTFSLFLLGCRNVMKDIDDLEEMDNPTNVRAIITKLPFKIRDKWRAHACDLQEGHQRARFTELVDFC